MSKRYIHVKIDLGELDRIKAQAKREYFYSYSEFIRVKLLEYCDQKDGIKKEQITGERLPPITKKEE